MCFSWYFLGIGYIMGLDLQKMSTYLFMSSLVKYILTIALVKVYCFNSLCLVSSKIDGNSNILTQFNKVACNDYVTPPRHAEDDYNLAHIVSPNICKYLSIYNSTA